MSNNTETYLIIHKDFPMGVQSVGSGAEMATRHLARFLAKLGHRVLVGAQLKEPEQTHDGVEYWDLGRRFDVERVLEKVRSCGSYHLISAGRALPIFLTLRDSACLSRILICHDISGNESGIRPEILAEITDQIICVSQSQSERFLEHNVPKEKITILNNGVDREIFSIGHPEERDYQRLVFAGALVQDKGIHVLISSYATLRQRFPNLKLDVYGSSKLWGREPFLDEKAIAEQLPGLTFHGSVPQSVVAEAYRTCGISVVPSIWYDAFPLTSIEAQVTGCPVVTFNVGGIKEGIVHGETGIVIEDISEQALTNTLEMLLSDPERLRYMTQRALEIARPKFTWERFTEGVVSICKEAARGRIETEVIAPDPKQSSQEHSLSLLL